jgi:dephospho-CoA kinase
MIIGITGTIGAGKGTIVEYLKEKKGFNHFSAREFIANEVKRRGLPVNRDTLTTVANDLRKQHSPKYVIEQLYNQAKKRGGNAVIESVRTPGEVEFLRKQPGFFLFAVDADPELRFKRIKQRASETDNIDFDTFLNNEKREMSSNDANKQNLGKCIKLADYVFLNNGSVKELYDKVETVLNKIEN